MEAEAAGGRPRVLDSPGASEALAESEGQLRCMLRATTAALESAQSSLAPTLRERDEVRRMLAARRGEEQRCKALDAERCAAQEEVATMERKLASLRRQTQLEALRATMSAEDAALLCPAGAQKQVADDTRGDPWRACSKGATLGGPFEFAGSGAAAAARAWVRVT